MNELSQRLFQAFQNPTLISNRPSTSNYPSSASQFVIRPNGGKQLIGNCNREQWYRRTGIKPTEGGNSNWSLAAVQGEYLHEMMSDLIVTHGVAMGLQQLGKETSLYDEEIKLSGRCDYLAWDLKDDEPVGIEFKSVGDWKSKHCLEEPAEEHILQSMLYLDYYQRKIPENQTQINKWYIWYVARGEGWHLKGAKQLSPFVQLWDFYITLDNDGVPTVHTPRGPIKYNHLSISAIKERFVDLNKAIEENSIPERDCVKQYSEESIVGMYKADMIPLKGQKGTIEKWLGNGAEKGKLGLEMGDAQCRFCGWTSLCWDLPCKPSQPKFNLPAAKKEDPQEEHKQDMSIL